MDTAQQALAGGPPGGVLSHSIEDPPSLVSQLRVCYVLSDHLTPTPTASMYALYVLRGAQGAR